MHDPEATARLNAWIDALMLEEYLRQLDLLEQEIEEPPIWQDPIIVTLTLLLFAMLGWSSYSTVETILNL